MTPERCFVVHCPAGHSTSKLVSPRTLYFEVVPRTLYFEVSCPPDTLLRSCPPDTLLRSRLSPHKGDNLLQGESLRSRVSGARFFFWAQFSRELARLYEYSYRPCAVCLLLNFVLRCNRRPVREVSRESKQARDQCGIE